MVKLIFIVTIIINGASFNGNVEVTQVPDNMSNKIVIKESVNNGEMSAEMVKEAAHLYKTCHAGHEYVASAHGKLGSEYKIELGATGEECGHAIFLPLMGS